jgi:outer membrane putative beta-barrel porin/alpha-amylase
MEAVQSESSAKTAAKSNRFLPFVHLAIGVLAPLLLVSPAAAHGPLFSAGPETLWKNGTEVTLGYRFERDTGSGEDIQRRKTFIQTEYGITSNWQIEAEIPLNQNEVNGLDSKGAGDITLGTKYQLFVQNLPGAQRKVSVFLKTRLPTGDEAATPPLGSGSTDFMGGLAVGHEGRRWYGFADARYLLNTGRSGGLERGNKMYLDVVGGIRPVLSEYNEPDTVLMLELNWENSERDRVGSSAIPDTGGWELFASPVLWWTYRQVAVKAGIQIPIARELNGNQAHARARGHFELVYHF